MFPVDGHEDDDKVWSSDHAVPERFQPKENKHSRSIARLQECVLISKSFEKKTYDKGVITVGGNAYEDTGHDGDNEVTKICHS